MDISSRSGSEGRLSTTEPLAPVDRLAAIDILRGIALFGVMAINLVFEFRVSIFQEFFTNYLMQSLIFSFVFYGYGLGLFGKLGAATALAFGLAVYVAQVIISQWWLAHFNFGPVEWLWRSLMYGRKQPMRPKALTGVAPLAAE